MVGEISEKSYMKGGYEEFHALRRRKNKPKQSQSNPILYGWVTILLLHALWPKKVGLSRLPGILYSWRIW